MYKLFIIFNNFIFNISYTKYVSVFSFVFLGFLCLYIDTIGNSCSVKGM